MQICIPLQRFVCQLNAAQCLLKLHTCIHTHTHTHKHTHGYTHAYIHIHKFVCLLTAAHLHYYMLTTNCSLPHVPIHSEHNAEHADYKMLTTTCAEIHSEHNRYTVNKKIRKNPRYVHCVSVHVVVSIL